MNPETRMGMKLTPEQLGEVFRIVAYTVLQRKLDPNEPLPEPMPNARKSTMRSIKASLRELYIVCDPSDGERRAIDQRLNKLGLPNLYALEPIWSNEHIRILKRGVIRSEEEFQFAEGLLDVYQLTDLTAEDSKTLVKLMNEYTARKQSNQT